MKKILFILSIAAAVGVFTVACQPPGGNSSPFGTWSIATMTLGSGPYWTATSISFALNSDATYMISFTGADLNPYWWSGTFTPTNLPVDTSITMTVTGNSRLNSTNGDPNGGPGVGATFFLKYSNLKTSSIDIYIDQLGNGTWYGPFAGHK
jgi:hypothetical protein